MKGQKVSHFCPHKVLNALGPLSPSDSQYKISDPTLMDTIKTVDMTQDKNLAVYLLKSPFTYSTTVSF